MIYRVKGTLVNRPLVKQWEGVGEEKCSISPITRAWYFSEPMSLDCELHKSFSVFYSPPLGGTGWARTSPICLFFFLQVSQALKTPQQVKLQLTSFPECKPCQEEQSALQISEWFLFPCSSGKHKGTFSDISIYCGKLIKLLEVNLTIFGGFRYDYILLEILTLSLVHSKPPAVSRLQFRFSYPKHWFPWQFPLMNLCSSRP